MKMTARWEQILLNSVAWLLAPGPRKQTKGKERRQALARANAIFARRYPRWANSLFDEYFIRHRAQDVLQKNGNVPPKKLAEAWTRQLAYSDEAKRRRHVVQVTPVAEAFLQLVRAEMKQS